MPRTVMLSDAELTALRDSLTAQFFSVPWVEDLLDRLQPEPVAEPSEPGAARRLMDEVVGPRKTTRMITNGKPVICNCWGYTPPDKHAPWCNLRSCPVPYPKENL